MIPRYHYLIKPVGSEYNNTKIIGGVELTVNATIENAKFVNRIGEVISVPFDRDWETYKTIIEFDLSLI